MWHSIYGGWSYATGHATAGSPLAGGLLTQLTDQFMAGGTMGWFTYQDQKGAFLEPANAGRVEYIRKLSQARIVGKPWMVHGRATRTLLLNDASGSLKGSEPPAPALEHPTTTGASPCGWSRRPSAPERRTRGTGSPAAGRSGARHTMCVN